MEKLITEACFNFWILSWCIVVCHIKDKLQKLYISLAAFLRRDCTIMLVPIPRSVAENVCTMYCGENIMREQTG